MAVKENEIGIDIKGDRNKVKIDKSKRTKINISIGAVVIVAIGIVVAIWLGGNGGTGDLRGYYEPTDDTASFASYSSFDFHGSKVTIGLLGGMQSYEASYTLKMDGDGKTGTLSFAMAGSAVNVPIEIIDGKTFIIGLTTYKKQ